MVTRITISYPTQRGYELEHFTATSEENKKKYREIAANQIIQDITQYAEQLQKIALIINTLKLNPTFSIPETIKYHLPDNNIEIRKITKSKRVYHIWLCYIHEEDITEPVILTPAQ